MKETIVIFAILVQVIGTSNFWKDDIDKYIDKWTNLKEMNCDYYQCSSPSESLDLDINTFIGGRPLGYKAKLHFAIAGRGSADIRLSDSRFDSIKRNNYEIVIGGKGKETYLARDYGSLTKLGTFEPMCSEEPTVVVIAVTDEGILTLTVDGSTLITFNDPKTFEITEVSFSRASWGAHVDFYYNCIPNQSNIISTTNEWKADVGTQIKKWTRIKEMECDSYFRTESTEHKYFLLTSADAKKSAGYKLNLKFSVIGRKGASIILSATDNSTSTFEKGYLIEIGTPIRAGQWVTDDAHGAFLYHLNGSKKRKLGEVNTYNAISANEPTAVIITITDNNVLSLMVGGKTIINYHESTPFEINYFAFASGEGDDLRFYYNCKSYFNNRPNVSNITINVN